MRKHVMIPALLALSVGLAACSHQPNANLEAARSNFSTLQSDPQANKVAALETKEAQEWLDKADRAYLEKEDEKKVDQLAYLTNQRVEVAKQTERGTLVTFGDVLFDFDRAELKSSALPNVTRLAQFLQQNPDRQVIVEGYTDSVGSAGYNLSLSERRANSVRTALVRAGVEPSRIVAQGHGMQYPVADNGSESGRAQNRRVEVTISNDDQPVAPRSASNG
jgi:outer membrane protein OmpA-like peptidoglycan-associated protein